MVGLLKRTASRAVFRLDNGSERRSSCANNVSAALSSFEVSTAFNACPVRMPVRLSAFTHLLSICGGKGMPFPPHIDNRCVKALKRTGIRTGQALKAVLTSKELKAAETLFAQEDRLSEPLSNLNTARLAVLLRSPTIFSDYFPELLTDPAIKRLLAQQKNRRKG